jgi:hypothetical protein
MSNNGPQSWELPDPAGGRWEPPAAWRGMSMMNPTSVMQTGQWVQCAVRLVGEIITANRETGYSGLPPVVQGEIVNHEVCVSGYRRLVRVEAIGGTQLWPLPNLHAALSRSFPQHHLRVIVSWSDSTNGYDRNANEGVRDLSLGAFYDDAQRALLQLPRATISLLIAPRRWHLRVKC